MEREQLVKHMLSELNWYVAHYDATNHPEVKKEWEDDYKSTAKAFNGLLIEMYGLSYEPPYFSQDIEKYKDQREWMFTK